MGFFSWRTSDTGRSIPSHYSERKPFTVHVITEDGQVFTEDNYEGYGVFGGKDIFVLAAELNGMKGETDDKTRDLFFDKIWRQGIEKDGKQYFYKEHFDNYESPIAAEGGKTPNQLVKEDGWKQFNIGDGDSSFAGFVAYGFKMPKIVEELPSVKNWKKEWVQLPYPEDCEYQGYFYAGADDDDEWEYNEEYEDDEDEY
jgi:hypothetical protein